jgi:hypothetical protein
VIKGDKMKFLIIIGIMIIASASTIIAEDKSGEEINWQVISSGGSTGSSTNYNLSGTVGQTAVGTGSSATYGLNHGYWQTTGGSPDCCLVRGDAKHDNQIILVDDIVYLVDHLFKGGPAPPCLDEGDAKADNGLILVDDIVYLVDHLFKGGPAPDPC